jgi:photosystem II oxygen-evolving enhancer protein 2
MKQWLTLLLTVVLAFSAQGCVSAGSGLHSYANQTSGYEFVYPNGWTEVKVPGAADVVFHDIINETENVSVVISDVPDGKTLQDLGTPTEMGYKLSKGITSLSGDSEVELVSAQQIDAGEKTYYILEYVANLPSGVRHNLASVIVRRGRLFTFNASTEESRWGKIKDMMKQSVASFKVY